MPRKPRFDFPDTTHHVFNRGSAKQPIFLDNEDRRFFLRRLDALRAELRFTIFAFCLMTNHFHLAIQRTDVSLGTIMQRLLTAYARVFNDKWCKEGHTFERRYGNRLVADDRDLMGLVRYIHMNPVEAGLCHSPEEWSWSSHSSILEGHPGLIAGGFILDLFGGVEAYRDFLRQPQTKQERLSLDQLAGPTASLVRGPAKTREASVLRREFIEAALGSGYRQSQIAAYLGRTRAAVAWLLRQTT